MKNGIYEQFRENCDIVILNSGQYGFPVHFHMNTEIFILRKGNYTVSVNGKEYNMTDGCTAFFSSYDLHDYSLEYINEEGKSMPCESSDSRVILIPPKYLTEFFAKTSNTRITKPVIHNPELCDSLIEITDRILNNKGISEEVKQAGVNLFLTLIREAFDFSLDTQKTDNTLIRSILTYILTHYKENVNVNKIAKALGYTPEHLSRTFHEYFSVSIPQYINTLRLEYIENKLKTDKKLAKSDVIYEAGFGCFQTYYRVKKQLNK